LIDAAEELAALVAERRAGSVVTVVGIAGPVAVGKSTLAYQLADALAPAAVEVVTTDGFLFANDELEARGLSMRKGFPESYDLDALRAFLGAVRAGRPADVPVYSHETYDVVVGAFRSVAGAGVVVLEGVNALSATVGLLDLGIYVHADDAVVEAWFVERFRELCANDDPTSFYARFAGLDAETVDHLAHEVWRSVNLVNLHEHIGPSIGHADVVVEKAADHGVGAVRRVAGR